MTVEKAINMLKELWQSLDGHYGLSEDGNEAFNMAIEALKEQPEIIRCKDCANCSRDALYDDFWCDGREVTPDHYCGYAERRT